MPDRNYWLALFTVTTWEEFIEAGAYVYGVSERYWNTMRRTKVGDHLICYVAGISRFIAILEITSEPYREHDMVWTYEVYPCRLKVKSLITLTLETAIPVQDLLNRLTITKNLKVPSKWTIFFRQSLKVWPKEDGNAVYKALKAAAKNPVPKPISKSKLKREYLG